MTDRASVKAALEAARMELQKAVNRVDTANPTELAQLQGIAHVAAAFVDFNSGCGKASATSQELMAGLRG